MNRTSNNILKCLLLLVVLVAMSGVASAVGAPNITSFAPASPVPNIAGESRTFNITANQTVNVTWYINGSQVGSNAGVLEGNYTNTSAAKGFWIVNATATNATTGLSDSQEWIWNVTTPTPIQGAPTITSFSPASPVSDNAGQSRTFNITADHTVTFTWYINSSQVQLNQSVPNASYTNTSAAKGIWNVSAVANNSNGSVMQKWTWNVTTPEAPNIITSFAPASPVSNNIGESRTFNITANQIVNVTWYINGNRVQSNAGVLEGNYTNTSAAEGIWIVNATATNTTTGLSASKEWTWKVLVANITGFTLDSSGTRGKWINASVNITNSGNTSQWFVIDVSGVNVANGYPLVGTATVRLNAGETLPNIPMRITVPPSASTGTYNLTAGIWKLGDFAIPDKLITTRGPKIVTIS